MCATCREYVTDMARRFTAMICLRCVRARYTIARPACTQSVINDGCGSDEMRAAQALAEENADNYRVGRSEWMSE
jgi:hypothetical protein